MTHDSRRRCIVNLFLVLHMQQHFVCFVLPLDGPNPNDVPPPVSDNRPDLAVPETCCQLRVRLVERVGLDHWFFLEENGVEQRRNSLVCPELLKHNIYVSQFVLLPIIACCVCGRQTAVPDAVHQDRDSRSAPLFTTIRYIDVIRISKPCIHC